MYCRLFMVHSVYSLCAARLMCW